MKSTLKLFAFVCSSFLLFAALEGEHIAASLFLLFLTAYLGDLASRSTTQEDPRRF